MITVFTPAYNRGYILHKLYESLCNQTHVNFEWLIIDDGSTDNTNQLVEKWIKDRKINIRYYRQSNGGKHRAINQGVKLAEGELFFIVDSDDHLKPTALEDITNQSKTILKRPDIAGVGFMRCYPDENKIGGKLPFEQNICSSLEMAFVIRATGDMAEVYKTDILRDFPFPEFEGERFCPEALVWFRIGRQYKMLWINKCIYVCDYLTDGLTNSIIKVRHLSPLASMLYYRELLQDRRVPWLSRLKGAINYWRFSFSSRVGLVQRINHTSGFAVLAAPIGLIMYFKDLPKL